MSDIWIPITIAAAFSQNVRTALQKRLTGTLSTAGATQVRFFYALPFALLYLWGVQVYLGERLPNLSLRFLLYSGLGGLAQIYATELLVRLFSYRNFFIGTSYSKTESLLTAIIGFFVLADSLNFGGLLGIAIGLVGVLIISSTKNRFTAKEMLRSLTTPAAVIGVSSGLFFAISAVCYRGASLSLSGHFAMRSAFTLACVLIFQTCLVFIYLGLREPGQISAVVKNWRISWLVGLAGMCASTCWFAAMTLENAAHVRALGQVELVFAFLASFFIFKEKTTRTELVGVSCILLGVLVLMFFK